MAGRISFLCGRARHRAPLLPCGTAGRAIVSLDQRAGSGGLRSMLREAHYHLNENGLLLVEVGNNRESVEEAYPDVPFVWLDTPSDAGKVFLLRQQDVPRGITHQAAAAA